MKLTLTTPGEPVLVAANISHLKVVFSNLLDNALKYTSEHGSISWRIGVEEDEVHCVIQDNGQGIAAIDMIFLTLLKVSFLLLGINDDSAAQCVSPTRPTLQFQPPSWRHWWRSSQEECENCTSTPIRYLSIDIGQSVDKKREESKAEQKRRER